MDFWTGFFSSRNNFKGQIRHLSSVFHSYSDKFTLNFLNEGRKNWQIGDDSKWLTTSFGTIDYNSTNYSRYVYEKGIESVGIAGHHDSITGTSPWTTIVDYSRIFTKAVGKTNGVLSELLSD